MPILLLIPTTAGAVVVALDRAAVEAQATLARLAPAHQRLEAAARRLLQLAAHARPLGIDEGWGWETRSGRTPDADDCAAWSRAPTPGELAQLMLAGAPAAMNW
jgi:hypothetical protein